MEVHTNKNTPSENISTHCDIPHPLVEIICILAWLRLMSDANFTNSYQFLLRVTTIIFYDAFIRVFQFTIVDPSFHQINHNFANLRGDW